MIRGARLLFFLLPLLAVLGAGADTARAEGLQLTTPYYCLLDADSGQVLTMKNGDSPRAVASTTKIMTAVLALEYCRPEETARVSSHAEHTAQYTIGLRNGQNITVAELLKAALIKSANDAAVVLAEHVAGDEDFFGHLMTQKAFCLGAFNTHFVNSSGLPAAGSCSTAYDLAVISRYALANPYFKSVVGQPQAQFLHPSYARPLTIYNTNTLLESYPGANGIKTGTTDAAGKCLVGSAGRFGRQLIAVVLRSADRSRDCARLLDYGFKDMQLCQVVDSKTPFKEIPVDGGEPDLLEIYPEEDVRIWQGPQEEEVVRIVRMEYFLRAPLRKGTKVGILEVYTAGKPVARVNLLTGSDLEKKPCGLVRFWRKFW